MKSRTQINAHTRKQALIDRLLTTYGHVCYYCLEPITAETATLDTVIPSGIRHNGTSRATPYYAMQHSIGNLRAVCGFCNWWKGRQEAAGSILLRGLAAGVSSFTYNAYLATRSTATPQLCPLTSGRRFASVLAAPPQGQIRESAVISYLAQVALAHSALRVAATCTCVTRELIMTASRPRRALEFSCPKCTGSAKPLAWITLRRPRPAAKTNFTKPVDTDSFEDVEQEA
ncbi:MAG TPA: hypothetical protein VN418_07615 [Gammaproteobacteria bacterium]|nr:hypothetical protein [Gammaproteobacteria bacterium]